MTFKIERSYWQRDIKRRDYAEAIGKSVLITLVMAYLFYHSWLGVPLLLPIGYCYYLICKKECLIQKREEFQRQFQEALQSLTTSLNVGYSMENALREVLKEMKLLYGQDAAMIRELTYITRQLEMNITVEQALMEFAVRVEVEDVRTFVTVFGMTKRTGGDMIAVLRSTVEKLCTKMEVMREIQTLVAAKRMEFQIMSVIPIGIIIYMKMSFSEFMSVLYGNVVGVIVMSICLGMYITAYYLGKTMLEIEV